MAPRAALVTGATRGIARGIALDLARQGWAVAITTVACFGVGLLTSEWLFGWATEEDLQPNVDGLSRDEVLLSSVLTTTAVVIVMRFVARRTRGTRPESGVHAMGRHRHA